VIPRTPWRDPRAVESLRRGIDAEAVGLGRAVTLMEVCGTHTHAIAEAGLRRLLPANVRLVAGPGCPVCVTPIEYMDHAVALARRPDVTVCTFGDLMRVPSSSSSLERECAEGHDVRIVYSPRDAVAIARANPLRYTVFLGVGFETTLPTIAAALEEAEAGGAERFLVLAGGKAIEPPLRALIGDPEVRVDGFLLPGHVSVVLGGEAYGYLEELGVPGAIAGFTPVDVMSAVLALVRQLRRGTARVENRYRRAVSPAGNRQAQALLRRWFEPVDTRWRGLGTIPRSGLALRPWAAHRDAARLEIELDPPREPRGCRCGDVLRGTIEPPACPLFDTACTPGTPVGACMVSSEGTCAAWYRHERLAPVAACPVEA